MGSNDKLGFMRIGPSGSDRLGSALLMYTAEPLRPPSVRDVLVDAARLRSRLGEPGATRIDLSTGARDAILRSPYILRQAGGLDLGPSILSSPQHILGISVVEDPSLPDNHIVFRDSHGNVLHTIDLVE